MLRLNKIVTCVITVGFAVITSFSLPFRQTANHLKICIEVVLVMHCGPCGVNCSEIFNRADCLAPTSNDI
ncbi:unnamed protein product, partial [Allacma fusca]